MCARQTCGAELVREKFGVANRPSEIRPVEKLDRGRVRAMLGAHRPVDNIHFHAKNSASQPAPKELIEKVAKNYKAALLALGD